MSWEIPTAVFALLALLCAIAPMPPGTWLDRLLHFFGIGAVSARAAALSLWVVSAFICAVVGVLLATWTTFSMIAIALDAAAIGLAFAFTLVRLASPKSRGTSLID